MVLQILKPITKISMYSFPKKENDNSRRQVWINRLSYEPGATKKFAPNKYSTLCAKHFEEIESAEQIGYSEDFRLYPDAVPTISKIPTTSDDRQNTS